LEEGVENGRDARPLAIQVEIVWEDWECRSLDHFVAFAVVGLYLGFTVDPGDIDRGFAASSGKLTNAIAMIATRFDACPCKVVEMYIRAVLLVIMLH
jgi:hypothetical protein